MTAALAHPLNVGTLATWLSLVAFGLAGLLIHPSPTPAVPEKSIVETIVVEPDFQLGAASIADDPSNPAPTNEPPVTDTPENLPLPSPPELAPLTQSPPLPEIPEIPPTPRVEESPKPAASPSQSTASSRPPPSARSTRSQRTSTGASSSGQGTSGGSSASRLAAGRMPAPSYPSTARRLGQTGTVVVEFTIGTDGRVIAAAAKTPSRWPLLNEAAVRAVRNWKFPPGGIMKLQRPIVFQLQ